MVWQNILCTPVALLCPVPFAAQTNECQSRLLMLLSPGEAADGWVKDAATWRFLGRLIEHGFDSHHLWS